MKRASFLLGMIVLSLACAAEAQAQEPVTTEPEAPEQVTFASVITAPQAAVLPLVKFSGTVNNALGEPTSGVVGVTFALYAEQEGGAPLWLETQNVTLDAQGHYTVLLGATSSDGLPLEIFTSGEARWLGIQAQGEAEQPRVLLVAVPYALKAAEAETLSGKKAADFILSEQLSTQVQEEINNQVEAGTLTTSGGGTLAQVVSGTPGRIAKFTAADAVGDSVVTETSQGRIGISTATPAGAVEIAPGSTLVDANGAQNGSIVFGTSETTQLHPTILGKAVQRPGLHLEGRTGDNNASQDMLFRVMKPDGTAFTTLSGRVAFDFQHRFVPLLRIMRDGRIAMGTASAAGALEIAPGGTVVDPVNASLGSIVFGTSETTQLHPTILGKALQRPGLHLEGRTGDNNSTQDMLFRVMQPDGAAFSTLPGRVAFDFQHRFATLLRIMRDGKVGIGTTAPAERLDVAGNINASGSITGASFSGNGSALTSLNASNLSSGALPAGRLSGTYDSAVTFSNASNSFTGGGAGLTNLNASNLASGLVAPARGGTGLNTSATATGSLLFTSGAGAWSTLTPGTNGQVLTLSGGVPAWANAGGGTDADTLDGFDSTDFARLAVDNTFAGSLTAAGLTVDSTTLAVDAANNRVGIGITLPSQTLHVTDGTSPAILVGDEANVNGRKGWRLSILDIAGADANIYQDTKLKAGGILHFRIGQGTESGAQRTWMAVEGASGRVGIGTTTPVSALDVNGTVTATNFAGNGAGLTGVTAATATDLDCAGCVGTTDLASNAVTSAKITDAAILFADINQNGCTSSQVMKWNGSAWACAADDAGAGGGNADTLDGLDSTQFARVDAANTFTGTQTAPTFAATSSISSATGTFSGNVTAGGLAVDTTTLAVDTVNKRVGIGTTTPATELQVAGGLGTTISFGTAESIEDGGDFLVSTGANDLLAFELFSGFRTVVGTSLTVGANSLAPASWATGDDLKVAGNATIVGNFDVVGTKNALVTLSDGRQVRLAAVESPGNWFEDFGTVELRNGRAWVALEPTYAQTVNTTLNYHVFLTPNGDCKGLYVARKTPTGFEVRELGGGTSTLAFDYRIVARRLGYESVRLEEVRPEAEGAQAPVVGATEEEMRQQRQQMMRPPRKLTRPVAPSGTR